MAETENNLYWSEVRKGTRTGSRIGVEKMVSKPKLNPGDFSRAASVQVPPGGPGFILQAAGREHYWQGTGLLSIKSFAGGRALYDTGHGLYSVDDSSYLVLNDGQPYSIEIESPSIVKSFCVFFETGLVEQVNYGLSSNLEQLLDQPLPPADSPVRFFEKTYPHDTILSPALRALESSLTSAKQREGWLEEQMHQLIGLLLLVQQRTRREALELPAVRVATREELYRRLTRTADYICACFDQPLTLKEMASVACLSPNHLLRSFRRLFHQTPHQYLTRRRLEHARKMLRGSDHSVTDVCFSTGYESLSSFSRMFRRHTGLSPGEYRRKR